MMGKGISPELPEIIYLTFFQAARIVRYRAKIDYKIPEYTYTFNVPIEMPGFKTEFMKEWYDMFTTLSERDQKLWNEFESKTIETCTWNSFGDLLERIFPNQQRRMEIEKGAHITAEEQSRLEQGLAEVLADELAKCFSDSKLTPAAREKIVRAFVQEMIKKRP